MRQEYPGRLCSGELAFRGFAVAVWIDCELTTLLAGLVVNREYNAPAIRLRAVSPQ